MFKCLFLQYIIDEL